MIVTFLGACASRILWLQFIFPLHRTLDMVFLIYPISWLLTVLAHLTCYLIAYKKMKQKFDTAPVAAG